MATGTATLNFGAFPGTGDCSVVITGQSAIIGGSLISAWLLPVATADHSADEHVLAADVLSVIASDIVAGTGFTIYGINAALPGGTNGPGIIYGLWTVGWAWL